MQPQANGSKPGLIQRLGTSLSSRNKAKPAPPLEKTIPPQPSPASSQDAVSTATLEKGESGAEQRADVEQRVDVEQLIGVDHQSVDDEGITYPEGGLEAWLVVLGSFCAMMACFGMMNTIGAFTAYISRHQLQGYDESTIGWIFSVYVFLSFFCGLQIGPIFDAKGPRALVLAGSVCLVASMMLLGLCTAYWHFMLVFGILGGIGTSLLFTPAVASIAHFFLRRRSTQTGLAAAGGSCGGVVFPLMLEALFPRVGFAWTTRILAFIFIFLTVIANLLIRSRLPPKPTTRASALLPDLTIFADGTGALALSTASVFFLEWGLFSPIAYLTSYSLAAGVPHALSYQLMAVFNAASCFGRYLPGYAADRLGRFNVQIAMLTLCMASSFALWLPAGGNVPCLVVFCVVFGFASGSNISLTPTCVGQLCDTQQYARYYGTVYTIVSFGTLTGIPIGGALIKLCGGGYWGVIVFTGCCYVASVVTFVAVRVMKVGWGLRAIY